MAILEKYKHSPRFEELSSELLAAGYTLQNRRVIWSGGVGSWRVMRGGIVRVLCRASTWGYKPAKRKTEGHWVQVGAEYGYKYGLCVEITPEGHVTEYCLSVGLAIG